MNTCISFIVPVYNVQRYLDACLSSIIKATQTGDQIILVNDGSTDNSGKLCEKWRSEYPDLIAVAHQANAGLSSARNSGLAMATKSYVYFLDSDDILCTEHFADIRSALHLHKPSVLICDALTWADGDDLLHCTRIQHSLPTGIIAHREQALISAFRDDFMATASRVYHRDLLEMLGREPFPKGAYYEDNSTIPRLLLRSTRTMYLSLPIYRYRIRPGSITQHHTLQRCMDQAGSFRTVLQELQAAKVHVDVMSAANVTTFKHVVMAVRNASRVRPLKVSNVKSVIEYGLSSMTMANNSLIAALDKTSGNHNLRRHALGMIRHPHRYVATRMLAGAWHLIRQLLR